MDTLWGTAILQGVLWTLLVALVMGWMARSRHRTRPTLGGNVLIHPKSTLIIGLVGFAFFSGIAVLSNVYRNETTTLFTTVIFLSFALLSALSELGAEVHCPSFAVACPACRDERRGGRTDRSHGL